MKVARRRRPELGPRMTIEVGGEPRPAKHPGETLALIEATRIAEKATEPITITVKDEDAVLYTIIRFEDKTIHIVMGGTA